MKGYPMLSYAGTISLLILTIGIINYKYIMANKREFKKYVEAVGASACNEMMDAFYTVEGADKDAISKAIEQVLCAVAAARSNSNIFFDKGVKAFPDKQAYSKEKAAFFNKLFSKITDDFTSQLDAALKVFNGAIPEEAKTRNKEAVANA